MKNQHNCSVNGSYCVSVVEDVKLKKYLTDIQNFGFGFLNFFTYRYFDAMFKCMSIKCCKPYPKDYVLKDTVLLKLFLRHSREEMEEAVKMLRILQLLNLKNEIFEVMLSRMINLYNQFAHLLEEVISLNTSKKEKKIEQRKRSRKNKKERRLKENEFEQCY